MSLILGTVILLNGTSSAGKTTLLQEFAKHNHAYRIVKIDDYFPLQIQEKARELGWSQDAGQSPWMFLYEYMSSKNNRHYSDIQLRREMFAESIVLFETARQTALHGQDCIIDTVLEYEQEYQKFDEFFKGIPVSKVLVYCSLEVIGARVRERNALGVPENMRTLFQSVEQFGAIYKVQEHASEVVVDCVKTTDLKAVLLEAINEARRTIPEKYEAQLDIFKEQFTQWFKLDQMVQVSIVPRHTYDVVLNTTARSPQELARELKVGLEGKQCD